MCCHWSILSWSRCLIHIIFHWIPFAWQLGCKAHILIFSPATIFFYVDNLLFMLLHEYYQEDLLQFVCGEKKIFQQVSMITLYTPSYLISLFRKRHSFLLYHWTCVVADLSLHEQNIIHVYNRISQWRRNVIVQSCKVYVRGIQIVKRTLEYFCTIVTCIKRISVFDF